MLLATGTTMMQKLDFIDKIERLGISYHFEDEIQNQLEQLFNLSTNLGRHLEYDLSTAALQFRLFRQYGFNISCGIFNQFVDPNGKFKDSLYSDLRGLLNLYEAAQVKAQQDKILEEVLAFTTTYLTPEIPHMGSNILENDRYEAYCYISMYEEDECNNKLLLRLAKLDYHLSQMLNKQDLCEILRWGKELDILSKVPYARDRFVECYFWDVGTIYEPRHSFARMTLAKAIAIAGIIDNTYDAYGTLDELKILTEAVERWDGNGIEQLSDYLKTSYMILLNFNKELEEDLSKKQTSAAFMGMDSATKDVMDWMPTHPKLFVALGKHTRLLNDVGSYKFERETGSGMAIECYMKDYNVFEEEAMKKFEDMAVDAWKDINEQCLRLTTFPRKILKVILNLARLCEVVYKQRGDGFTNQRRIEAHIKAILVDSISL
nr:vetispiradiene synthase 1-like [Coffea arabica]